MRRIVLLLVALAMWAGVAYMGHASGQTEPASTPAFVTKMPPAPAGGNRPRQLLMLHFHLTNS
jgi:hypothetical protein